jgi:ubiquinone/menaquinone biosynthesis C-methylase UbiE
MEIEKILSHLTDGDRVLDIGCANGHSSLAFASQRRINLRGLDYIPEMIAQAKAHLSDIEFKLLGEIEFDVGDITALNEPDECYDKVIVIRVLINLGEWECQRKAFLHCARVLKPGGTFLLSEATMQGWQKLNQFRSEWGLSNIAIPPFNQYLDENKVVEAAGDLLELVEISNFASTYFVGSRVLKPLLALALNEKIDIGNPLMEWNRWFSQLPACGDYGTQKLFVFRKR